MGNLLWHGEESRHVMDEHWDFHVLFRAMLNMGLNMHDLTSMGWTCRAMRAWVCRQLEQCDMDDIVALMMTLPDTMHADWPTHLLAPSLSQGQLLWRKGMGRLGITEFARVTGLFTDEVYAVEWLDLVYDGKSSTHAQLGLIHNYLRHCAIFPLYDEAVKQALSSHRKAWVIECADDEPARKRLRLE